MEIIKRDGSLQPYQMSKISQALEKALIHSEAKYDEKLLNSLVCQIEKEITGKESIPVETIQDLAEKALMQAGLYDVAKRYILYREKRTRLRNSRETLLALLPDTEIHKCLCDIQSDFQDEAYSLTRLKTKFETLIKDNMTADELLSAITRSAVELTSQSEPQWEFIASRLLYHQSARKLHLEEEKRQIHSFADKITYLTEQSLYGEYICHNYTNNELNEYAKFIDNERNKLFTFSGLDLMLRRYVIHDRRHVQLESPQEMFLGIALHLAMNEKTDRANWVKTFYDMLSTHRVTMATPTLSNARKPYHQLSSCFIDTVPDSLDGIYRSLDNFAKVSKFGGGMGMYFGKIRAIGGSIRGFEGAAGGVIRWIKLVNDTAVAVDQLGMRSGAVAVYLDAWHKDLPEFLQLRTNNGDDRMKAHDVFPAVCYPDLFWKMAKENLDQNWYLMCPHDVLTTKGYALEDYYGEEWEKRYLDCVADSRISKREVNLKELVRLILKSAVETGTPFAFYRDAVNKANPNNHEGIIYCSNLCTEIAQNMSPVQAIQQEVTISEGESVVVTVTKPGDFVVCNLASLNLGRIDVDNEKELDTTISAAIRALDNVIDLNFYPLPYAKLTNHKYRSIGLGVSGYHHMLAKKQIKWESDEHLKAADIIFENINYSAIKASSSLAKERGSYEKFNGSDWQTGSYFEKRNYNNEKWQQLAKTVAQDGLRNAYILAVAPTSSTSILVGTTAGLDPIMHRFFLEEKKGAMLPRVAPSLCAETYWFYKNAHIINQTWSVKAAGIRQRHIDQAQSFNLYITNEYTMRQVLDLYICAWECGVKTIYYVRSKSLEVEECESCSS